jgi:heme A synthase
MTRIAFRFAVATAVATFLLLLVGGTVNPTGSSLACPDWPTCYGSFFPAMKDGVEYEHTHRLAGTAVGLMSIALAWMLWRIKPADKTLRRLGLAALALVVLQGVLGGVTVLLRLPTAISATHLALSMIVLGLFVYLAFRLWPGRSPQAPAPVGAATAPRAWAAIAAVVVYLQILLGALVRHMGAGRACNDDFPWCAGSAWPTWGPAQLHMLHRWGAVLTTLVVLVAAAVLLRTARSTGRRLALRLAIAAPIVVSLQFLIGTLTVTSNIGVVEATAHLGAAALLLINFEALWLALGPIGLRVDVSRPEPSSVVIHPREATS